MSVFVCPVCRRELIWREKTAVCENGHSYDISRNGYVNLLMSSKSGDKRHGDDKLMIRSRRDFLELGYYRPLLDGACAMAAAYGFDGMTLLDAGCGECYYTAGIADCLHSKGIQADINGVDISKDALVFGGKRRSGASLAVASVFELPAGNGSCDMLINFFAPFAPEEFARVLTPGGVFIRAVPLEEHLMGLKAAVYDTPYLNPPPDADLPGFELLERRDIEYTLQLTRTTDIKALFMMTPYYYKTGRGDQEKLDSISQLTTQAAFGLFAYRRL